MMTSQHVRRVGASQLHHGEQTPGPVVENKGPTLRQPTEEEKEKMKEWCVLVRQLLLLLHVHVVVEDVVVRSTTTTVVLDEVEVRGASCRTR